MLSKKSKFVQKRQVIYILVIILLVTTNAASVYPSHVALNASYEVITSEDLSVIEWVKENLDFDQMIWEFGTDDNPDWVHISYNPDGKQRNQLLVAYKDSNNRTRYKQWKKK